MKARDPSDGLTFAGCVLRVVASIPRGRATSYGVVATLAGTPRGARAVASVLRSSGGVDVPWHRVVGATRTVSLGGDYGRAITQRALLEEEGVRFRGDVIDEECWWDTAGLVPMRPAVDVVPLTGDWPPTRRWGRRR